MSRVEKMNEKFRKYKRNEYSIERDGKTIELTPEELREIVWLHEAREGLWCLDAYLDDIDDSELDKAALLDSYDLCIAIQDGICERVYDDSWAIERKVVRNEVEDFLNN